MTIESISFQSKDRPLGVKQRSDEDKSSYPNLVYDQD